MKQLPTPFKASTWGSLDISTSSVSVKVRKRLDLTLPCGVPSDDLVSLKIEAQWKEKHTWNWTF